MALTSDFGRREHYGGVGPRYNDWPLRSRGVVVGNITVVSVLVTTTSYYVLVESASVTLRCPSS